MYRAWDRELGMDVALKELRRAGSGVFSESECFFRWSGRPAREADRA